LARVLADAKAREHAFNVRRQEPDLSWPQPDKGEGAFPAAPVNGGQTDAQYFGELNAGQQFTI